MIAAIVMLLIASVSRLILVSTNAVPERVWVNTLARLDPMACGILLACILSGRVPNFSSVTRGAILAGGVFTIEAVGTFWNVGHATNAKEILLGYPLAALGCSAILIATLGIGSTIPRSLIYVGKISYGLYVYHMLGKWCTDQIAEQIVSPALRFALRLPIAFLLTLALAALSYRFLESPFLKIKERFAHIQSRPV